MQSELRNRIVQDIWHLTTSLNAWISIPHIPGKENLDEDLESRVFNDRTEWSLPNHSFNIINDKFSPFDIDLFASWLNNKVKHYYCWTPDPFCSHVDCFTLQWSDSLDYYAFPPFSQILPTIWKILQDSTTITLVAPLWPNQPWFSLLLDQLVENLIILPKQLPYLPWDS